MVSTQLQIAGAINRQINQSCAHYLTPACRSVIVQYQGVLSKADGDLSHVAVPNCARGADHLLHEAINADAGAAKAAITAIDHQDLIGFLGAWGMHGHAGLHLLAAKNEVLASC